MPQDLNVNPRALAARIKALFKRTLRHFGFDIVRHQPTSTRPINVLDLAVRAKLAQHEDLYFIQVGANDGVRHDPLRDLVLEFGLHGILVEPLPDMFDALRRNYADQPQLLFKNAAVSSGQSTLRLARFRAGAQVHDDLHSLASTDTDRIETLARRHGVEDEVQYVDVPCVTFEDLIEEYNIRSVDLLIIDVEGQEWELLQAAFQAGLAPAIVFMEFLHLPPGDRLRAEAFLARRGYDIAYSGIDLIGLQPFRASRDRSVTTGSRPRTIS